MKRLILIILLASTLRAEDLTPEQRIAYLQSIVARQAEQIATLQQLLTYFQQKPSPQGAVQAELKKQLEQQCGGTLNDAAECVKKETK